MDSRTFEILVLIFVFIVVAGTIAVFVIIAVAAGKVRERELKRKLKVWRRFAGTFGFLVTRDGVLYGNYNSLRVEVRHEDLRIETPQVLIDDHETILRCLVCSASFPHSLNLSLSLQSPKSLPADAPANKIVTGHTTFDSAFDSVCANREVLLKLLSYQSSPSGGSLLNDVLHSASYIAKTNNDEIAALLSGQPIRRMLTYHFFEVTDIGVTVRMKSELKEISEQSLRQIIDLTTFVTRQIYSARAALSQ